jgi:hypothetical protein
MIAGGGGGASASDPGTGKGGAGGGLTGQDGQTWSGPGSTGGGLGGTQTAGGRAGGLFANTGSALQGGSGSGSGTQVAGGTPGGGGAGLNTSWGGSGGGGGYWGGGAGQSTVTFLKGFGGGGSGYLHPILVTNGATIAGNNSIVANASDVDRGTTAGAPTSTIGGSGRIVLSVKRVINSPGLRGSSVAAQAQVINYVTSGLVTYLDAGSLSSYSGSGTTWTDISPSSKAATFTSSPSYVNAGASSYFNYTGYPFYANQTSANISLPSGATFLCWFYRTQSITDYTGMINDRFGNFGSTSAGSAMYLAFSNQVAYNWQDSSLSWNWSSGLTTPLNAWCMAVVTVTFNSSATLYLCQSSGITSATNTGMTHAAISGCSYSFGLDSYSSSRTFIGRYAVAMIYNRPLSAPEVSQNFDAFRSRYGV